MKKYIIILTIIVFLVIFLLIFVIMTGFCHGYQHWPEDSFIGKSPVMLAQYLERQGRHLSRLKPISSRDRDNFEDISGNKISRNHELYHFWGGENHMFWHFPIGTTTYGAYVLVENGIIVKLAKNKCVDTL